MRRNGPQIKCCPRVLPSAWRVAQIPRRTRVHNGIPNTLGGSNDDDADDPAAADGDYDDDFGNGGDGGWW